MTIVDADPSSPAEAPKAVAVRPVELDRVIRHACRGILSARLARFGLLCLGVAGLVLAHDETLPIGMGLLFATAAAWVVLVTRTARNQQDLMRVPAWIDAGQFALADTAAVLSLGRFSIAVRPRLQALRHLAVSLAAQGRLGEARRVAEASLRYRQPKGVFDGLQLIVGQGALAMNDLTATHTALAEVIAPLSLQDSLKLLELQTDYCVRVAAWQHAVYDLPSKVEMAELLTADHAAAVQAMLALAARRVGHVAWANWLANRARLLTDVSTLVARQPALAEVFAIAD